jgi:glucokinase
MEDQMAKAKAFIGVDLGGTSLLAAVVSPSGEILGEAKRKTRPELGASGVMERLVGVVGKAIKRSGVKRKAIGGVGVGVPGPVCPRDGLVVRCPNLGPTWNNLAFAKRLAKQFAVCELSLAVTIDNDVNVGAVGEHTYGAGRGSEHMLAIFVGTGLGGGVIIDGKLYAGAWTSAGEVGHMPISPDGPLCSCGKQGHAEALASRSAIEREIKRALDAEQESLIPDIMARKRRHVMSSSVIGEAYEARDRVTVEAVEKAQYHLGLLVAACVNLMDPQVVVIGGGVVERFGESYLEPVRRVAAQHIIGVAPDDDGDGDPNTRIVRAALGDYSGALGAAVLARQRLG